MNQSRTALTLVLGAGASRGVSYAYKGGNPSPLDSDFFDLLQRLKPTGDDKLAVESVIDQVRALPRDCWKSMERAFYSLHLRALMANALSEQPVSPSGADTVVAEFARCIQASLRTAHGKLKCANHKKMLETLGPNDTVISFNYDLVPERAIRVLAQARSINFGPFLYGLANRENAQELPLILKLHGSSNWKMVADGENEQIEVRMKAWSDFDGKPGYRAHQGDTFPILLPFWDKRIEKTPWLPIWQLAFKRLHLTKYLVVWGYSLPTTDVKAQQLFSLGLPDSDVHLCVIDPLQSTRDRWRALLPKSQYWEYENIGDFLSQPPLWWRSHALVNVARASKR